MWDWQQLLAAELPPAPVPADNTQFYLVFAGVAITALASVVIAVINRGGRTTSSPPAPAGNGADSKLTERVAVNESKLAGLDNAHGELEDTVDVLDRRHAKTEVRVENLEARMGRLERQREERGPNAQ